MENVWNPENQWSVAKDAGRRVDMAVKAFMDRDRSTYAQALVTVKKELPLLYQSYVTGVRATEKKYEQLSASQREMVLLQADPDRVKFLAGALVDKAAQGLAGGPRSSAGIAQISVTRTERRCSPSTGSFQMWPKRRVLVSSARPIGVCWRVWFLA